MKIAIQGFEGSFHQMAAFTYWGKNVEIVPCKTFRELVQVAADPLRSDGGLMAIENSIAGSILPNYNLLKESKLTVSGEVYLQIRQNLLAYPGVGLEDIREVHSHPMAILQCLEFIDRYNWKVVETEDTALSARMISEQQSRKAAAIASTLAADLFGLEIVGPDIHTQKHNYTRFLVLQRETLPREDADKASVYFQVKNEKGSLSKVLHQIAIQEINLSKLQSFPIPGSNWLYSFHADMEFEDAGDFHKAIALIKPLTNDLKVYGIYKRGGQSLVQAG